MSEHLITDAGEEILATYNLCLVGTDGLPARVLADLPAMLEAVEEDLSDLLPDGFRATIKEWSSE